jgi:hypothetical protein
MSPLQIGTAFGGQDLVAELPPIRQFYALDTAVLHTLHVRENDPLVSPP